MLCGRLDADWTRFQQYAPRVRSLRYRTQDTVHASVWTLLARRCNGHGLLPNIWKLDAMDISLADIAPVTLLFAPSMRDVHLAFDDTSKPVSQTALSPIASALFDELFNVAGPHLTELWLFRRFPLAPSRISAFEACRNLRHLLLVDLDTVFDIRGIRLLEQLGPLLSLALTIRLDDSQSAVTELHLDTGFPALTGLWVCGSAPDVAKFVPAARPVALHTFDMAITGSTDMSSLQRCSADVGAHLPRTVREFRLAAKDVSRRSPTASLGDLLRPFYPQKRMRSVTFDLDDHVPHTSDDDLRELAQAWPRLDYIRVGGGAVVHPDVRILAALRRPTVRGLVELAQHCPRIRAIDLPVLDTTHLPSRDTIPVLGRIRAKHLRLSWVSSTDKRMHFDLAVLLDRLFPNLEGITIAAAGQEVPGKKVHQILEAMQMGRKHARLLGKDRGTGMLASGEGDEGDEDEDEDEDDEDREEEDATQGCSDTATIRVA